MSDILQVYLDQSDLSLDEIEEYAKDHGFKSKSEVGRYALEKLILGFKNRIKDVVIYVMLLMIIVMVLLLIIVR